MLDAAVAGGGLGQLLLDDGLDAPLGPAADLVIALDQELGEEAEVGYLLAADGFGELGGTEI
ncbi:hypothetical protein G3I33_24370 [Streptomyces sp. SID9124]|nr:hypothetical protein [Streptomyces sp. SID9124]